MDDNCVVQMGLSDFVSLSICEIANGLSDAAAKLADRDVMINPLTNAEGFISKQLYNGALRSVQALEFDIAVAASSGNITGGGAGVKVLGIMSFGGKLEDKTTNTTASRLKFSIPVSFPTIAKAEK